LRKTQREIQKKEKERLRRTEREEKIKRKLVDKK
jgi:hypothetical protein